MKIFFSVVIILLKNYTYLCTWTISLLLYLSKSDEFFHDIRRGSLRRAEYGGVT